MVTTRARELKKLKKRNVRITEGTLAPKGALKVRLDRSLAHFPVPLRKKKGRCQLHRWCGYSYTNRCMDCEDCKITLCLGCWKKFHCDRRLAHNKKALEIEFSKQKNPNERRGGDRTVLNNAIPVGECVSDDESSVVEAELVG